MLILSFNKIDSKDTNIAGGKGASLGEMTQAGIPVPPGFIILSTAFDRFIEETRLVERIGVILESVNYKEIKTIDAASEKIQALIHNAKIPDDIASEILKFFHDLGCRFVAVRSSATSEDSAEAAWAGQLDTYLNTTQDQLLNNVRRCWASLFTPRAIFYRFDKGLNQTKISVAVVVQKMVESEISGIAFSVHPVTQDYNQIIIEAGFGLGEAIVSGSITPDSYVVEKNSLKIISKSIAEQKRMMVRGEVGGSVWKNTEEKRGSLQTLSDKQIIELADIIVRIEKHYGFPCDIEWAFENNTFYIVQSRPITTLGKQEKRADFKKLLSRRHTVLVDDIIVAAWNDKKRFNGMTGIPEYVRNLEIVDGDFYFDENWVQEVIHNHKNDSLENFAAFLKRGYAQGELLKDFARNKINSILDLKKAYDESTELLKNLLVFLPVTHPLAKILEERVIEILRRKGIKDDGLSEALLHISTPRKLNGPNLEIEALKDIKRKIIVGEKLDIDSELERHVREFGYLGYREPFSPGYNKTFFKKRLEEIAPNPTPQLESAYDFNKEEAATINALQDFVHFRNYRTEKFYEALFYIEPVWAKLSLQLRLKETDLAWYRQKEIDGLLNNGNPLAREVIESRKRGHALLLHEGSTVLLVDKELVLKKEELAPIIDGLSELKGFVAFKGRVRGRVKILTKASEQSEIAAGDILVASMTTPDFLPAMEKAAAFVTDEGGITCHAAIVAREMRKPCIIGTKIATKVLRTGDIVEVNGDKGIVTVLTH